MRKNFYSQRYGVTGTFKFKAGNTSLSADFPSLKTLESRSNNLPVQPNRLIGREKEIRAIRQLLLREDLRLLTLTGPGGMGKTRLALQVAEQLSEQFADGVFFVNLASTHDAAFVVPSIA